MTLYGGDVYIEVGMSVSQNRNVFFTKKQEFFFFSFDLKKQVCLYSKLILKGVIFLDY
jgi:hypothetical protein